MNKMNCSKCNKEILPYKKGYAPISDVEIHVSLEEKTSEFNLCLRLYWWREGMVEYKPFELCHECAMPMFKKGWERFLHFNKSKDKQ